MVTIENMLNNLIFDAQGKNEVQIKAYEYLNEIGLPGRKSENYKYTPITSILQKNIDWDFHKEAVSDFEESLDGAYNHVVLVNGRFSKELSQIKHDITVTIEAVAEGKHDPFSLLNTAFAKEEIIISGNSDKSSTFIYYVGSQGFTNPRVRVKVGKHQQLTIVEKVLAQPNTFTNASIEFNVSVNAIANHTKVQDYGTDIYTHEATFAHVSRDAKFYNNTFSFGGAMVRNNLVINLEDENCEGHMNGVFLLDGKSHVDNNTSVDHQKPNSYSNELYKGILDEKATGIFNGKIYVRKDAQKTNAFQSNNNILLSDDATIHTKPQLEIWADDVKCSHGCTSGQLDEDAIFYLRARGIDTKSAKGLLLNAFAGEALQCIPIESVRDEIQEKISNKLK